MHRGALELRDELAHCGGQRRGRHGVRVGVHVDELRGDERLVGRVGVRAPDLEQERHAGAAELRNPHQHVQQVVIARRAKVVDRSLAQVDVVGVAVDVPVRVGQADGAPVFRNRDVDVVEVVAVEDDLLHVDFRPAHAQAVGAGVFLP